MRSPTSIPTDPDRAAERLERRRQRLQELVEIGLGLARALEREAQAAAARNNLVALDEFSQAFAEVSRSVRLTIALKARLDDDRETLAALAGKAKTEPETEVVRRRAKICGAVEQAIEAEVGLRTTDGRDLRARVEPLVEREALAPEFMERPLGQIIAHVCRDLGLTPDWRHWDADWAADARKAAAEPPPHPARGYRHRGPS
jgi:hypothetical protein